MAFHRWDPICPPPRGLVRPVRGDPMGVTGPTRGEAAGPRWRRTSQGFHVRADVDETRPEQRVIEQSVRLPAGGAVTGWGSLRMSGANFLDGLLRDGHTQMPVPLVSGQDHHPRGDERVVISREPLDPDEVVLRHGVPCTADCRALFDEMRRLRDPREAVVAMDMTAAAELVSIVMMREYVGRHSEWRRARQVTRALGWANERSRSPNETRLRLIWELDAGFPRPMVNRAVFTLGGKLLGYPDLFDPIAGVVGEFDGADHRGARRHSKDVSREDGFRRAGLEYFKVTGPDLPHRALIVNRMRSTRSRALWLPERSRRWTTKAPPDWGYEETLDEILDHRAWMRSQPA